jgi:hypothetical protein
VLLVEAIDRHAAKRGEDVDAEMGLDRLAMRLGPVERLEVFEQGVAGVGDRAVRVRDVSDLVDQLAESLFRLTARQAVAGACGVSEFVIERPTFSTQR